MLAIRPRASILLVEGPPKSADWLQHQPANCFWSRFPPTFDALLAPKYNNLKLLKADADCPRIAETHKDGEWTALSVERVANPTGPLPTLGYVDATKLNLLEICSTAPPPHLPETIFF